MAVVSFHLYCFSTDDSSTQHSMLVVGYGREKGTPYWLVKNSWSKSWGIDGYIKIAWKNNTCGVTKKPVVALMHHTSFHFPVKEKITYINPSDPTSMGRKIHAQPRPQKRDAIPHPYVHNYARSTFAGDVKDKVNKEKQIRQIIHSNYRKLNKLKRTISGLDIRNGKEFFRKTLPNPADLPVRSYKIKHYPFNVMKRRNVIKANKLLVQFLAEK